jgi:hypothetical protein
MNRTTGVTRSRQVLLIGAAFGSGKTSVSSRLAHNFNVGITRGRRFPSHSRTDDDARAEA